MQVLKLGGSVLTRKGGTLEAHKENISSLSGMLGRVWRDGIRDILLIHGAGSFGHPLVVKYGLDKGVVTQEQKLGAAETHSACVKLSALLVDSLISNGIPAVSMPPSLLGKLEDKRLISFNRKPVDDLLSLGYMPVLHGDMMPDSRLGCAVCSGDQLVSWFGRHSGRVILGTNVDGVLADDKLVPVITSKNFDEVSAHFHSSVHADVTGGMKGKVNELLGMGKPAYVVNALHPGRIEKLLRGEETICTLVR